MALSPERIAEIAEGAATGVANLIAFTDGLALLRRQAAGEPVQLSPEQAEGLLYVFKALVQEGKS